MASNTIKTWTLTLLIVFTGLSATSVFADVEGTSKVTTFLGKLSKALSDTAEAARQRNAANARGDIPLLGAADEQKPRWNSQTYTSAADQKLILNGMWRDPDTGLTWMRCNVRRDKPWAGNSDSDTQCASLDRSDQDPNHSVKEGDWAENMVIASKLNFGGYSDWRIPTAEEVSTLLECSSQGPLKQVNYREVNGVSIESYSKVDVSKFDSKNSRYGSVLHVICGKGEYGNEISPILRQKASDMGIFNSMTSSISLDGEPLYKTSSGFQAYTYTISKRDAYAVRSDIQNDTFSQNLVIAKQMFQDQLSKEAHSVAVHKALRENYEAQKAAEMAAARKDRSVIVQKVAKFRSTVRAGDYTTQGQVIQVNGNRVLVQTSNDQQWFNRNDINPAFCSKTILCWWKTEN